MHDEGVVRNSRRTLLFVDVYTALDSSPRPRPARGLATAGSALKLAHDTSALMVSHPRRLVRLVEGALEPWARRRPPRSCAGSSTAAPSSDRTSAEPSARATRGPARPEGVEVEVDSFVEGLAPDHRAEASVAEGERLEPIGAPVCCTKGGTPQPKLHLRLSHFSDGLLRGRRRLPGAKKSAAVAQGGAVLSRTTRSVASSTRRLSEPPLLALSSSMRTATSAISL